MSLLLDAYLFVEIFVAAQTALREYEQGGAVVVHDLSNDQMYACCHARPCNAP